jgi:hypothetical protein
MRHLRLGVFALAVTMLLATPGWARPRYQSDLACDGGVEGFTVIKRNLDVYGQLRGVQAGTKVSCRVNCKLPDGPPHFGFPYFMVDLECGGRVANAGGTLVTISRGLADPANGGFPGEDCREPFIDIFGSDISGGGFSCVSGYHK